MVGLQNLGRPIFSHQRLPGPISNSLVSRFTPRYYFARGYLQYFVLPLTDLISQTGSDLHVHPNRPVSCTSDPLRALPFTAKTSGLDHRATYDHVSETAV